MKIIFLLTSIITIFGCGTADKKAEVPAVANINGEELFKNNCASCHKCDSDFTGPALNGSLGRWGDKASMYEFIRNPFGVIRKNEYAQSLQKKFGGAIMTPSTLSDKEIDAILDYCSSDDPAPIPSK